MNHVDIDQLFADTNVISTRDLVVAFTEYELSDAEAREWAEELGVAKIGPCFAWTQPDAEGLADELDALDAEYDEDADAEKDADDQEHDDTGP